MNGNVKSVLDKAIFASPNPILVFQDLVFTDNISRYLKEKYITFSLNCVESFSNVEDVIGNYNDAPAWYMKLCEISKKHDHKYSAEWYKRLYEISQKHSQEKVIIIFENFENLDATIVKVFFDYVIGDKKLEFPENVKIILNSGNRYYNKIYSKFSDYCDLVRIRGENKIFWLPLEAKQNDKKLVSSKILDGEIIKSSQLLVNSVDIDPKVKNAIDHVLHNQSAPIYITNRTDAPCFEYLRSIYKSVVLKREEPVYYTCENQIVCSTLDEEVTVYDIRKEFPFFDKIPKFESILNAPKWYIELCKKCSEYPNEKILMIFNNLERLDFDYYTDLARATLPNYSVRNWVLPKNAQLVFIENKKTEYYYSDYNYNYNYSNCYLIKNHCSNVFIDNREIRSNRFDEDIINEKKQNEIGEVLETTFEPILLLDTNDASATRYLKNKYRFVAISANEYGIGKLTHDYVWYKPIIELSQTTDEKVLMIFDDDLGNGFSFEDVVFSEKIILPTNVQMVFSVTTDNYRNVISPNIERLRKKCVVVDNRDSELLISGIIHDNEDINKKI